MNTPAAAMAPDGAAPDDAARRRLFARLAMGLLLDLIAITRGDGNVLDTVLAGAIIQANVREIVRRADLQLAWSEEDAVPPDELRRPVSMHALSTSLGLPFETVRRRVRKMVAAGFCRAVEGGVIVPTEVLTAPKYYLDGVRSFERLRGFYDQAADLDLLGDLPRPTVELAPGGFPIRAVARLMGAYVLRVVESLPPVGDLTDGLIWLETYRANVEAQPQVPVDASAQGPDDLAGDARRSPLPVTRIAARLGLPQETVRRHTSDLVARGRLARVPGGLIVPAKALARPELGAVVSFNAANLHRLFAGLSQLGVLAVWDGLRTEAPRSIPQNE